MKVTIKKKVREDVVEFEFEERDIEETMKSIAFLTEPMHCHLAPNATVYYQSRDVKTKDGKDLTYVERKALDFGQDGSLNAIYTSTMGKYQRGGYFWKKWEKYVPEDKGTQQESGDVPF